MDNIHGRRKFLKLVTAGTCGALVHQVVTPYSGMMAYAQSLPAPGARLPVLVVINLDGGCSYNIAPIYNGAYRDKNPTISYGPEAVQPENGIFTGSHFLTNEQGLHPSLSALKAVYDEGNLALINSVGYPNPNRSHDESAQIWFRGTRNGGSGGGGVAGWGARLTSQMASAYAGFSLAGSNLLINGGANPPRSLGSINGMQEENLPWDIQAKWFKTTRDEISLTRGHTDGTARRVQVANAIEGAQSSATLLRDQTNAALPAGITFPDGGFGQNCQQAARLIRATALGVQFIFLQIGGFDTHSDERRALTGNLNQLNAGLSALINFLKHPSVDRWHDTTIVTMSEFCRTFENASQGTDHGHAAPMFMFGGRVKGGIKSSTPSAAEVAAANGYFHAHAVDYREPFYAAVQRMGFNPGVVFPEGFNIKNLDLFL